MALKEYFSSVSTQVWNEAVIRTRGQCVPMNRLQLNLALLTASRSSLEDQQRHGGGALSCFVLMTMQLKPKQVRKNQPSIYTRLQENLCLRRAREGADRTGEGHCLSERKETQKETSHILFFLNKFSFE